MEKVNNCDRCGFPAWKAHGGMGGSIMPDSETHCLKRDGMDCRSRRIAYLNGIQKGVEVAQLTADLEYERAVAAELRDSLRQRDELIEALNRKIAFGT